MSDPERIGATEEIDIASLSPDGTLRKRTTIWIVRVLDDLYVRAVNGRDGVWFRGTQDRHEGRIWADDTEQDVTFVDADPDVYDAVDEAYRAKYKRYPPNITGSVLTEKSRASTLRLVPR